MPFYTCLFLALLVLSALIYTFDVIANYMPIIDLLCATVLSILEQLSTTAPLDKLSIGIFYHYEITKGIL
ncbi:hypothetical protein [Psychrobacter sp. 72-O-c]|uniref:hypothetical protein n=1 Tax=Psychrobacter sp. 72-O-c TaxID=2774125 RepID=UPI00191886F3|nr:hypothetical protein [Psychrobacter sp. 72-O-c]